LALFLPLSSRREIWLSRRQIVVHAGVPAAFAMRLRPATESLAVDITLSRGAKDLTV